MLYGPDTWKRPTAEMENAYIEANGYDKYCLWFLGVDPELRKYATELVNKPFPKQMMLSNGKYSLHLELDEDTYWGLVKLGAEIKTDCETYAEHLLIGHVESGLDK